MTARLQRLPLSVRMTALFTGLTILLLATAGTLVYLWVGRTLRVGVDERLRQAAVGIRLQLEGRTPPFTPAETPLGRWGVAEQLLDATGRVIDRSRGAPADRPMAEGDALARALAGQQGRQTIPGEPPMRVWAVPAEHKAVAVIVVAASLDEIAEAQQALFTALMTAGLGTTLCSALAGWMVARRGLAPVDRMTARAAEIHVGDLDQRLPVPHSDDEIARLGKTLNSMLQRLSEAIERERAFTADASHELRTPLAILRAEVELARDRAADADVKASLNSALEEADRLSALVDDLLVLARADADRLGTQEQVDLGDLAAAVVDRFRVIAATRRVTLRHSGAAVVGGDQRSLERALANLVDNALRHTPEGGRVDVVVAPAAAGATLTVTDTGPGVEEELLARLFDRFSHSDPARTSGGAGLGLAIVAAVAAAHSGQVAARNLPDAGLEVVIRLPGRVRTPAPPHRPPSRSGSPRR
jgi:heavy metal sensor kinase